VTGGPAAMAIYHQALAAGVSRGLLAASGIALAALLIAVITIRGRRVDFGSPEAMIQPAQTQPGQDEVIREWSSLSAK
jgi:threonine/homoserine/homoserine lactone efflux protein